MPAAMALGTYDEYKTGMHVLFGAYEQDGNAENGKEDIEWLILDIADGKALLLSVNALDTVAYSDSRQNVTWENASLKAWLESDFYAAAFRSYEKLSIVSMPRNAANGGDGTASDYTEAKVSLLSEAQLNRYFPETGSRVCYPSIYAKTKGAGGTANGAAMWYIRMPDVLSVGYHVSSNGTVFMSSGTEKYIAVRPCIWVKLDK